MSFRGLVWITGGPQGSGVDTAANVFARAVCYAGYNVFGNREYHSNIKGLHSYFYVRMDERPVRSHSEKVNLLTSFDAETVFRHAESVTPGGGIIYDQDLEQQELAKIQTIDLRAHNDIGRYLQDRDLDTTVSGILSDAKKRGIQLYPIPYMGLLKVIAAKIGEPQLSRVMRLKNILAVGVSFALLGLPMDSLLNAIRFIFSGKRNALGHTLVDNGVADFGQAMDI